MPNQVSCSLSSSFLGHSLILVLFPLSFASAPTHRVSPLCPPRRPSEPLLPLCDLRTPTRPLELLPWALHPASSPRTAGRWASRPHYALTDHVSFNLGHDRDTLHILVNCITKPPTKAGTPRTYSTIIPIVCIDQPNQYQISQVNGQHLEATPIR